MSALRRVVGAFARFGVHVLVFSLIGPLIGFVIFFNIAFFGALPLNELGDFGEGWLWFASFTLAMSYALGILPAAAVGGVLGLVSAIFTRTSTMLEALLAAIVVPAGILFLVLTPLETESGADDMLFGFLVGVSVIATFACRAIAGWMVGLIAGARQ